VGKYFLECSEKDVFKCYFWYLELGERYLLVEGNQTALPDKFLILAYHNQRDNRNSLSHLSKLGSSFKHHSLLSILNQK